MKKLIILLAAAAVAVGCSKKAESLEPDPPTPPVPPETVGLSISFERTDDIAVWPGRSIDVAYTLTGVNSGTQFECSADNGWRVEIHATSASSGYLHVTAPSQVVDGDVTMRASNDESDFTQQTLHFVGGFFEIEQDVYNFNVTEQELAIVVRTNIPYEVFIPDDAAWIERITDPNAVGAGTERFSIARNSGLALRRTEIEFMVDGDVVQTLTITQRAAPSNSTDIIRFADKTLEARLVEYYDLNEDGAFSYQEAAAITELKEMFFANSPITSFDEFQYFTGLTDLPSKLFFECYKLKSIILPENIIQIGESTFAYCTSLSNIILPDGLETIGSDAFLYCTSLTNIVLPDVLKTIGLDAFMYCTSLTNIVLPDGLETIDDAAFVACECLEKINIPNSVNTIGSSAFGGCSSLASVTLPDHIEKLSSNTFTCCSSLKHINLPSSLRTIGNYCFHDCSSLTSIELPEGVIKIGLSAFLGCSFSEITFPSRVEAVGEKIVNSSASSITFLSPMPPKVNQSLGLGLWHKLLPEDSVAKIYVPAASLEAYKTAYDFLVYADRIFPIEE